MLIGVNELTIKEERHEVAQHTLSSLYHLTSLDTGNSSIEKTKQSSHDLDEFKTV